MTYTAASASPIASGTDGLISWNEISEGSYIDPMTRYGYQDLNALSSLIK
jgi:hypothetical protein